MVASGTELGTGPQPQLAHHCGEIIRQGWTEQVPLQAALNLGRHVRHPHAQSREHTGQRVNQYRSHAESFGDPAGVLASRATETRQHIVADIVAPFRGHFFNGCRHAFNGDFDKAFRQGFQRQTFSGHRANLGGDIREFPSGEISIEGFAAAGAKYPREIVQRQLAKHQVAVSYG